MHIRAFFCAFSFSILQACGGGGGSPPSGPSSASNNSAPVISGNTDFSAKALDSTTFSISVSDADGDTLSAKIKEQTDMVSISLSGSSINISIDADFFHIGQHTLTLQVSDGTATSEFPLTFEVEDNPDKWQDILLTDDIVEGSWKLENGASYHFYPDGQGLYVSPGKQYMPVRWRTRFGAFYVSHLQAGCIEQCSSEYSYEVEALYQSNGRFRLFFGGNKVNDMTLNTVPVEMGQFQSGYYGPLINTLFNGLEIDTEQQAVRGTIIFEGIGQVTFEGQIQSNTSGMSISLKAPAFTSSYRRFFNLIQNNAEEYLYFKESIESIDVHYLDDKVAIFRISTKRFIDEEQSPNIDTSAYFDLDYYLDAQLEYLVEVAPLQPENLPSIEPGDIFISRFKTNQQPPTGVSINGYANQLRIDSADSATVMGEIIGPNGIAIEESISWHTENNTLTLTYEDEVQIFEFFSNHRGVLLAKGYETEMSREAKTIPFARFVKSQSISKTQEQWQTNTLIDRNFTYFREIYHDFLKFEVDNKVVRYGTNLDTPYGLWQLNSDDSVDMLRTINTCELETVEQCSEQMLSRLNDGEPVFWYMRRFKPIYEDDYEIVFKYEFRAIGTDFNNGNMDIRTYLKN